MENVILTSTGFSNPVFMEMVKKFFWGNISSKKAAIVTTASEEKERNYFALLAHAQLGSLGFESVVFFDIERQDPRELLDFDVIYVNGGNTYYLLHWAKKTGFDKVVLEFVRKGGMYIGVSAGSVIAGVSIEVLNYTGGDPNDIGLADFSGMELTRRAVVPHYSDILDEDDIRDYESRTGVKVARLVDGAAMVGQLGEKFSFIEPEF